MAWAKKNKELTEEDWARIIWSDECYIYLDDNKGRVYVTRRPDEVLCDDCVVPSFKESTIRVMVWGCIIKGRLGPLVVLEYPGGKGGGMNSERYQEQVLSAQLHSFYMEIEKELGLVMFQQDNAAAHASKSTAKWLKTHVIKVFGHPSNSPDLNPIERIWHVLKTVNAIICEHLATHHQAIQILSPGLCLQDHLCASMKLRKGMQQDVDTLRSSGVECGTSCEQ